MKSWNINRIIFAIAFIVFLSIGEEGIYAQNDDAEQGQIVIDDLSRSELRTEIEKIQNEFYRVFNASNDDDDFDIVCHQYTATGTNIPDQACEPKFIIQRRGDNATDYQNGLDELLSAKALLDEMQPSFTLLTEKMNALAKESEYFRELNQILQMLRARLAELEN